MINLDKISTNGKMLFLAYDQGMEHGPVEFDDENVDPENILKIGVKAAFNAIIFQKGIAEKYYTGSQYAEKIPLIIKLNGKTNLVGDAEPYSPQLCGVLEAHELGANAVGYTIYVGSEHESKMTAEFAKIVGVAHSNDIPVIGWMYPRGKSIEGKSKREITAYAARLGLELGADIVKIHYPDSIEDLSWAVESAGRTKVVCSGGAKEDESAFLQLARDVMAGGAVGMAVGRNIWKSENPQDTTKKLKDIVFA